MVTTYISMYARANRCYNDSVLSQEHLKIQFI